MHTTRRTIGSLAAGALAVAAATPILTASAQTGSGSGSMAADEAAIVANIETFRAAMVAKDTAKLGELVADSLNYGHSAGVIENKEQFLKAVAGRKAMMKSLKYPDIKVQVNGSVAVARHVWEQETELDGKQDQGRVGVFQVWQKQADGKWKLYGRQSHIFPPKT